MKIIVNKFFRHDILTKGQTRITKIIIEGATFDECCRQRYELDRSLRYNNFTYNKFEDESLEKQYMEWKKENETIELYYGGGVVD